MKTNTSSTIGDKGHLQKPVLIIYLGSTEKVKGQNSSSQ
jgi:hypothetical protein